MKYVLLLLIVLAGIWWIRKQRQPNKPSASADQSKMPQPMLPCAQCGTHIPESDAVPGKQGHYCSEQHRQIKEG